MKSTSFRILVIATCAALIVTGVFAWRSRENAHAYVITRESNLADLIGRQVMMTGEVDWDKSGLVICQGSNCVVLEGIALDDPHVLRGTRITASGQLHKWVADPAITQPSQGPASGEYFYISNATVRKIDVPSK